MGAQMSLPAPASGRTCSQHLEKVRAVPANSNDNQSVRKQVLLQVLQPDLRRGRIEQKCAPKPPPIRPRKPLQTNGGTDEGTADTNIRFDDLRSLLATLGFSERVRGSHHIFARPGVAEILNVQPRGSFAKLFR
jgi:hypothetical protein